MLFLPFAVYKMSTNSQNEEKGKTVLIPVDGSERSERAFQWYCNNMHQSGNEVILLNANDLPQTTAPYSYGCPFPHGWKEAVKESSAESERILQSYFKKCKDRNIKCRMFTESDSPGEAILRLAKEKSADHIVMGSRGRDPISRTLAGSISYFCTHHSDVPISVVPPPSPRSRETLGVSNMDDACAPTTPIFNDPKELYETNIMGYI